MPPWHEGYKGADEKRLKVLRRTAGQPRAPKKRCKTQPIAHPSARKATRVLPNTPATAAATAAAEQEIGFMADLCASHKIGTLLCIQREAGEDGITEQFRSLPKPESCAEQKIWTMVADADANSGELPIASQIWRVLQARAAPTIRQDLDY